MGVSRLWRRENWGSVILKPGLYPLMPNGATHQVCLVTLLSSGRDMQVMGPFYSFGVEHLANPTSQFLGCDCHQSFQGLHCLLFYFLTSSQLPTSIPPTSHTPPTALWLISILIYASLCYFMSFILVKYTHTRKCT